MFLETYSREYPPIHVHSSGRRAGPGCRTTRVKPTDSLRFFGGGFLPCMTLFLGVDRAVASAGPLPLGEVKLLVRVGAWKGRKWGVKSSNRQISTNHARLRCSGQWQALRCGCRTAQNSAEQRTTPTQHGAQRARGGGERQKNWHVPSVQRFTCEDPNRS